MPDEPGPDYGLLVDLNSVAALAGQMDENATYRGLESLRLCPTLKIGEALLYSSLSQVCFPLAGNAGCVGRV